MRAFFISIVLVFILLIPWLVFGADTDCPFGLVNDTAPGICARYVDNDGTDICDLSEVPLAPIAPGISSANTGSISEEELKQKTVAGMAQVYNVDGMRLAESLSEFLGKEVSTGDSLQALHDNDGLCTGVAGSIAASLQSGGNVSSFPTHELITGKELKTMKVYEVAEVYGISDSDYANAVAQYLGKQVKLSDTFQVLHDNFGLEPSIAKDIASRLAGAAGATLSPVTPDTASANTSRLPRYKLVYIVLVLIIFYFLTYILAKEKKITMLTHRRIWHVILLFSFLSTAILALLLIIRINLGWAPNLPFNVLYWHVETGTVMATVSVFHGLWHWRYYTAMLKRKK